jgi:hypothetical protein
MHNYPGGPQHVLGESADQAHHARLSVIGGADLVRNIVAIYLSVVPWTPAHLINIFITKVDRPAAMPALVADNADLISLDLHQQAFAFLWDVNQ